jgi:hypothetical protein
MRRKILVTGFFLCLLFNGNAVFSQWRQQNMSIKTRWSKPVNIVKVLPEYPRPQLVRSKWTNLNGLWEYAISGKEVNKVDTYNGKILVPYPIESALSGVKKKLEPTQLLWYKRSIAKPVTKNRERILLHFGAVDFEATVFINGKEIGNHKGGYQNFSFDVTNDLKPGNNELLVKVWDPSDQGPNPHGKQVLNPQGIMYTPSSGIWQTVWMETVPADYIDGLVITPDVDASVVKITVKSSSNAAVELKAAGQTLKGNTNEVIIVDVKNARLWSPDDPYLYDLTVKLGADIVKSYFGMRKIVIKKDAKGIDRIFLNNKYYFNLGTLDQGYWPDGLYTAPTDEALKFDIVAAKAMGFNTIRKHIKIEPARWYYHADKIGMLVWQDMVNPGNDTKEGRDQFEKECAENIVQLYNYPCITTWVLFNEKWGQYDQDRLTKWMKQTDPTRLVNGHSGEMLYVNDQLRSESPNAWVNADMTDVHAYPMPGHIKFEKGKAAVLGEFGGIGVPIEGHLWDDLVTGWGYDGVVTPNKMKVQYTQMIDSLKVLEQQGLSASIYTQPFDVESEQNGLMTYDREMIKLPVTTIRSIHARLWPATKNIATAGKEFAARVADTATISYSVRLKEFEKGRRDSAFLRSLTVMARERKDVDSRNNIAQAYIQQIKDPFRENNLKFIKAFASSVNDKGFAIFYNNIEKVNSILGDDEAESIVTRLIERDYILNETKENKFPDWNKIEKETVEKFGELGRETTWQAHMLHAANNKDWKSFGSITEKWFTTYGHKRKWIGSGLINGIAWSVFKNTMDTLALKGALAMTWYAVQREPSMELLDTHANLLYKLGHKIEAIKWEEKALALAPNHPELKGNYEKMLADKPTWPVK